jgi:hypothetical protein
MTEEVEQQQNNPGYKSRKMLADELEAEKAKFFALMARIEALEAKPSEPLVGQIVEALRTERLDARSAALERELREAHAQIQDLQRPETPTSGVPYTGLVQATQDCWDLNGYHYGPKEGKPGDVFTVSMPDYWPGCPFVPVIAHKNPDGSPYYLVHPDFQSH